MSAPLLQSAAESFGRLVRARRAGDFFLRLARYQPGLLLPDHRHPNAYFSFVVQGGIEERCGGGLHRFGAGSAHFHSAGEPHSARVGPDGLTCLSIVPDPRPATWLARWSHRPGELRDAQPWARRCYDAFREEDEASDLMLEAAGLELIAACLRAGTPRGSVRSTARPRWIDAVRDVLHQSYARPVALRELAAVAGVHEVHVVRGFRRHVGLTPGAYLRRLRVEAARDALIHTSTPLAEIALATGFASQSHLTRLFRRATGLPPGAYRRRHRSDETTTFEA